MQKLSQKKFRYHSIYLRGQSTSLTPNFRETDAFTRSQFFRVDLNCKDPKRWFSLKMKIFLSQISDAIEDLARSLKNVYPVNPKSPAFHSFTLTFDGTVTFPFLVVSIFQTYPKMNH